MYKVWNVWATSLASGESMVCWNTRRRLVDDYLVRSRSHFLEGISLVLSATHNNSGWFICMSIPSRHSLFRFTYSGSEMLIETLILGGNPLFSYQAKIYSEPSHTTQHGHLLCLILLQHPLAATRGSDGDCCLMQMSWEVLTNVGTGNWQLVLENCL